MTPRTASSFKSSSEHGFVLFIALVFLLILTLLGVVMLSNVGTQSQIAGNFQQKSRALLAANSAVQVAFGTLSGQTVSVVSSCSGISTTPQLCPYGTLPNPILDSTWTGSSAVATQLQQIDFPATIQPSGGENTYAAYPEYNMEKVPGAANVPGYNVGLGQQYGGGSATPTIYQVNGWGVGANANAIAVIQALYMVP